MYSKKFIDTLKKLYGKPKQPKNRSRSLPTVTAKVTEISSDRVIAQVVKVDDPSFCYDRLSLPYPKTVTLPFFWAVNNLKVGDVVRGIVWERQSRLYQEGICILS